MAKKTILVRARLVQGEKWTIDYTITHVASGQTTRHRKDFGLNAEKNLEARAAAARAVCRVLETFDWPAESVASIAGPALLQSVQRALEVKLSSPRANTHKGYKYIVGRFLTWAASQGHTKRPATDFGKREARAYWDALRRGGKYSGTTLNNYLTHLKAIWSEMAGVEDVTTNPWAGIKPAPRGEKHSRVFEPHERRTVAEYIRGRDYWLFRALLLQYYLYIRPVEIARLKFRAFDFARGVVTVEAFEAKKWKKRVVTIPAQILHYFTDGEFDKQPGNWYILGRVGEGHRVRIGPSPVAAHPNHGYKKHRKHLVALHKSGALHSIKGLTWYGWKYTGISAHVPKTSPISTRDQAGHGDFDTTLTYYTPDPVNQEYRALPDDLFA